MLSKSICMSSDTSVTHTNRIVDSLLKHGEQENLHTVDRTEIARKVENNKDLILMEFWSRRYFPTFSLSVVVNPEYGGSSISVYGRQNLSEAGKESFDRLVSMLKSKHLFEFSDTGEFNECP